MKATQVDRLVAFLRSHPGATGGEIFDALRIPKYTSRVSDARVQGYVIDCRKLDDGLNHYFLRESRFVPVEGEQIGAFR